MNKMIVMIVLAIGVVSGIFTLCGAIGLLNMFIESETIFQQIYVQVCMCTSLLCWLIAAVGFSTCALLVEMGLKNANSPFRSPNQAVQPPFANSPFRPSGSTTDKG